MGPISRDGDSVLKSEGSEMMPGTKFGVQFVRLITSMLLTCSRSLSAVELSSAVKKSAR